MLEELLQNQNRWWGNYRGIGDKKYTSKKSLLKNSKLNEGHFPTQSLIPIRLTFPNVRAWVRLGDWLKDENKY